MITAVRRRAAALGLTACAASLCLAGTASAETVTASSVLDRSCIDGERNDSSVAQRTVTVPGVSAVTARLAGDGDWDLAVIDPATDAIVAGSAFAGGDEVAQGFSSGPGNLIVQACRRSGADPDAELSIETVELTEPAPRLSMVRVATPTEDAADELAGAGFDLTEHGGDGFLDVVLHGPAEGALLNDMGFYFEVLVPDLAQQSLEDRLTEQRLAARGGGPGGLPSGRTDTYRTLPEYSEEMQELAAENPRLVRYFTLKKETYEGRPVEAIEVAPGVKRSDGRPTFLMMGTHHAREWPSSEHTIEFAYELINGYKDGDRKTRRLLTRTRVVFVPVVNPDGFNLSRQAGEAGASGGRDAPGGDEIPNLLIPSEYHRKNCRFLADSGMEGGSCSQPPMNGLSHFGVDPNRNYGGFWGGPGAATGDEEPFFDTAQDYRGPGPFSEPETQNIRKLVSKRHVVTLITNHTFSNLVLHPPGLQAQGKPRDDKLLRRLADAMARENGYTSQAGFELYDTSGTTEDWSYNATSGLGYTFEIGPEAFHPAYPSMIDEYNGDTEAAEGGGGNSAAYIKALKSSAKTKRHSLIKGKAPRGSVLTLNKRFKTPTSPVIGADGEEGDAMLLPERLRSQLKVNRKGRFEWHVNPSTRPIVDPSVKRIEPRKGKPSEQVEFAGTAPPAIPCGDFETENPMCWNDHGFSVKSGKGIDNGTATVRISWPEPGSDWDLKVFRDTDGDGSSEGEKKLIGSSAQGATTTEETTSARPGLKPGKYVARVINFAAASPYEGRVVFGKTPKSEIKQKIEKYTLTCRAERGGRVLSRKKIAIDRGERVTVNLRRTCSR